jgi:DNA-binding transcriptional ArsR family regulator
LPEARYTPPEGLLELTAEQARLFAEPTRNEIVTLITERPASIKELAAALGKPKGSVGHHVGVLEAAGLIRVVATRKVRAITEKFYGRVARTYVFPDLDEKGDMPSILSEALGEMREPREGESGYFTLRHARIDEDRVVEFAGRLTDLAEEYAAQERSGTTVYGLLLGLYPTDRPSLPERTGEER